MKSLNFNYMLLLKFRSFVSSHRHNSSRNTNTQDCLSLQAFRSHFVHNLSMFKHESSSTKTVGLTFELNLVKGVPRNLNINLPSYSGKQENSKLNINLLFALLYQALKMKRILVKNYFSFLSQTKEIANVQLSMFPGP